MEGEMTMQPAAVDKGLAHTLKDDVYGMVLGVMFIAVGLNLLKCAGMITGGIAGIALLLAHVSSLPIGVLFFLANLPFLVFGYVTMGRAFMVKTLLVNVAGTILGLPLGLAALRFFMTLVQTDAFAFTAVVRPESALFTLLAALLFVFACHGVTRRVIRRLAPNIAPVGLH